MKRIGTVSYNKYCNFTNYGSALHTWALHQAIKKLGHSPVLVDYCPDVLADKNPLDPIAHMWDKDDESRRMCELSFPEIKENYLKFERFYRERFENTSQKYTADNFHEIRKERIDGFLCGSDTIFCIDEFGGFDDGYFADYPDMRGHSVAYAASFGDPHFDETSYEVLNKRLLNFKAIGLREEQMIPYVRQHSEIPVERTVDPTLLLTKDDYDQIADIRQYNNPYLLLYARRYEPKMEAYAERIAKERGLKIIEISLRKINENKGHVMRYDAGVEEFLSIIKHSSFVVTNSFHGMIFAVQYHRQMAVFTREQAETKINELLDLMGIENVKMVTGEENNPQIDYDMVQNKIAVARKKSFDFLKMELEMF